MDINEDNGSLSERITTALMDEISTVAIKPGTVLEESALTVRFGASRTPVREALRQLEAIGLIEIRPRRGAVVLPMTLASLMEMFEVVAEMECMCIRIAINRINGAERARLRDIYEKMLIAVETEDFESYDAINLSFHETIYRATHNEFLYGELMRLRIRLLPFRQSQLHYPERLKHTLVEHGDILKAIMRGDAVEAERVMREHMLNAGVTLAHFMQDNDEASMSHKR
ncbi:GntR family transcriptional regulator [Brucella sp. HL-2]|nr:GntR family transcriptional regulator [Brucella sp. HL-2]MCV9910453.1 GntR family transcriptional regulator [Brucella sp. HL-2]